MTADVSTNYSGRTTDLLVFHEVVVGKEFQVSLTLGNPGTITTGIQKVAQQFGLQFLTDKGSKSGYPTYGTGFLRALRSNRMQTEEQVPVFFNQALLDIRNFFAENPQTGPADEIYADAELLSFDLQPGSLKIYVRVYSLAGDSRAIVLPVEVVIR